MQLAVMFAKVEAKLSVVFVRPFLVDMIISASPGSIFQENVSVLEFIKADELLKVRIVVKNELHVIESWLDIKTFAGLFINFPFAQFANLCNDLRIAVVGLRQGLKIFKAIKSGIKIFGNGLFISWSVSRFFFHIFFLSFHKFIESVELDSLD